MSLVGDFKARIEAIDPPIFRMVAGAAEFASIGDVPKATPAVYILVEEEQSSENERATGPVLQRTEADIAAVMITRNVADASGGAAAEDLEMLKAKTRSALIGFVPPGIMDAEPVTHVSGNLLKAKGGYVWHRELFATAYYQEEES